MNILIILLAYRWFLVLYNAGDIIRVDCLNIAVNLGFLKTGKPGIG